MEREVNFLMMPDDEAWSYEGALRALKELSIKYRVKAEFERELGDFGYGLEERWYLKGNREDIFALVENFEECAKQCSGTSKIPG